MLKWSRYRPGVVQRVGRGIALPFHDRGTRRGWVVSSTPRSYFTPGKDPVPILQEAGWAPGPVWTDGKSRHHRDSIPNRPARSQSLYRLSYTGPPLLWEMLLNFTERKVTDTRNELSFVTCVVEHIWSDIWYRYTDTLYEVNARMAYMWDGSENQGKQRHILCSLMILLPSLRSAIMRRSFRY